MVTKRLASSLKSEFNGCQHLEILRIIVNSVKGHYAQFFMKLDSVKDFISLGLTGKAILN